MTQLSEQDRQRIEADAYSWRDKVEHEGVGITHGYIFGATAERLLAESEKEELRKKWDCDKAALNEAVRKCNHYESEKEELTEVLGMAKAHMRDCTYSPQDLTQQENERFKHILDEIDRLLNQTTKP